MPYTRKVGEPPTLSRTETPPNTRKAKVLGTPKTSDQKQQTTPKPVRMWILEIFRSCCFKSIARAEYSVGDKILCLHGGTIYYEAKILSESALDNGERAFLVHYQVRVASKQTRKTDWAGRWVQIDSRNLIITIYWDMCEEITTDSKNKFP